MLAIRWVVGRLLGAEKLIPVASAHIDGALYHGDSGTLFAERLVELGAKVATRRNLLFFVCWLFFGFSFMASVPFFRP